MALRGSAGNSLVCYLIGITDVDPIRFGLEPERFLHPGRTDLPDIDLDFDWRVRDEVIAHTIRRYGAAHAAQISTHQFFQPRSAFREAGRIHGLSDDQPPHAVHPAGREGRHAARRRVRAERAERNSNPVFSLHSSLSTLHPLFLSNRSAGRVCWPTPAVCWVCRTICRSIPAAWC